MMKMKIKDKQYKYKNHEKNIYNPCDDINDARNNIRLHKL